MLKCESFSATLSTIYKSSTDCNLSVYKMIYLSITYHNFDLVWYQHCTYRCVSLSTKPFSLAGIFDMACFELFDLSLAIGNIEDSRLVFLGWSIFACASQTRLQPKVEPKPGRRIQQPFTCQQPAQSVTSQIKPNQQKESDRSWDQTFAWKPKSDLTKLSPPPSLTKISMTMLLLFTILMTTSAQNPGDDLVACMNDNGALDECLQQ